VTHSSAQLPSPAAVLAASRAITCSLADGNRRRCIPASHDEDKHASGGGGNDEDDDGDGFRGCSEDEANVDCETKPRAVAVVVTAAAREATCASEEVTEAAFEDDFEAVVRWRSTTRLVSTVGFPIVCSASLPERLRLNERNFGTKFSSVLWS
jgi:hypothetical protein